MNFSNIVSHFNDFYGGINGTTFSGAIDVIVIEQPDLSFKCSPFHVRFGKLGILHSKEKIVDVTVNDVPLDFHMKLGDSGEAFFVEKVDTDIEGDISIPANLICSPILADVTKENLVDGFASENVFKKETNPSIDEIDFVVEGEKGDESQTMQPKIFRAETSEVKLSEKINSFHGEFRPILSESDVGSSSDSNDGLELPRRKKKSILKKKSEGKCIKFGEEDAKMEPCTTDSVIPSVADKDYHYFSDSEAGPENEASSLRVHSILSDSEVDKKSGDEAEVDASWKWGELPAPPQTIKEPEAKSQPTVAMKEESPTYRRSMIGTMLSFMKKTKYIRNVPEVTLPEPVVPQQDAKPKTETKKEEDLAIDKPSEADIESGCEASISQSPEAVEDRAEEIRKSIAMSLCGKLDSGPKVEDFLKHLVTWDDLVNNHKLIDDPNLVIRFDSKYYNWKTACPMIFSVAIFNRVLPQTTVDTLYVEYMPKKVSTYYDYWWGWGRNNKNDTQVKKGVTQEVKAGNLLIADSEELPKEVHRKVLRLTSDQIAKLNLKPGQNEVVFSVTSAYQGTSQCKCHIYRWRHDDRIVISDIDGTITKSDVLGHILPILGRDWAQSGVAELFSKIKNNGYKLLYLSARAIGQASTTRDYLKSIKQAELSLPDGPVLLSPTGLLNALHREVIDKRPEDFKIPCLKDIQSIFPEGYNPFYAGYGNKVNDVWSYRAVGIPMFRIFTINHRGELKHEFTQTFQTTYSNLSFIVDHVFPPNGGAQQLDDYSSFVYWREPLEDVIVDPTTKEIVTIKTEAVTDLKD